MGLNKFKKAFFEIRSYCEILIRKHAFADYPERGFSQMELIELVKKGTGRFEVNKSSEAINGSFLFYPKDEHGRECKLVVVIEILEIENENPKEGKKVIIVCSAYRRVENEI